MKRVAPYLLMAATLWGCSRQQVVMKVSLATIPPVGSSASQGANGKVALRVAVAPVISPKETLASYSDLVDYLGKRLGRPSVLLQGSSYAEVNELVRYGKCDLAFV
ncbi:MAG: PhnD/SsuA/transferrin family substrate-binding protein [Armatimonadetes bacterium]|nr:PhnD/SsuA/transferrin family substrate-binding protein [Armatimonadota bacterium]